MCVTPRPSSDASTPEDARESDGDARDSFRVFFIRRDVSDVSRSRTPSTRRRRPTILTCGLAQCAWEAQATGRRRCSRA